MPPPPPPLWQNGSLRLRACREGALLYHVTDAYVGRPLDLYGEAHGLELAFLAQAVKPGTTIVDVGANIGAHAVAFARMTGAAGRVVAIEPQREAFRLLCANLALNLCRQVEALRAAAGARRGRIHVPVLDHSVPGNYGGVALAAGGAGEEIEVIALDELDLPACHLLKIDVEGMENEVLEGARATIARHRPLLYVENDRDSRSRELIERLLALGHRLWWHMPPLFNPRNHFANPENVFPGIASMNLVAVPRERAVETRRLRPVAGPHETWRDVLSR